MIATVPLAPSPVPSRASLEYLLLGDLRLLLEEPASSQRDRWLVATLDMLLMSRPRSAPPSCLPSITDELARGIAADRFTARRLIPFDTLQRLRDRIVHRAPREILIRELKDDLCEWTASLRSLTPIPSPACPG